MKLLKVLAAAGLALSFCACTSSTDNSEVVSDESLVQSEDSSAISEAESLDSASDENGDQDADYGTPENSESTNEVPTTADEQQAPEQAENNDVSQAE